LLTEIHHKIQRRGGGTKKKEKKKRERKGDNLIKKNEETEGKPTYAPFGGVFWKRLGKADQGRTWGNR